ncbi:hypothetical protein JTB14_031440 [Gonioctena quinquepunctata]|nr:hypothetical protein JTB14_031440 [Gonioctena quinquepunctata]
MVPGWCRVDYAEDPTPTSEYEQFLIAESFIVNRLTRNYQAEEEMCQYRTCFLWSIVSVVSSHNNIDRISSYHHYSTVFNPTAIDSETISTFEEQNKVLVNTEEKEGNLRNIVNLLNQRHGR